MPDFLDLRTDPELAGDRLLLGIRHFDEPFLLTVSLSQGLGSSELWLDRGRAGKARLAEFRRVGNRVLFAVRNKHFLTTGDPAAVRAGQESFALSVVWSAPVLREEDGVVVVDATGLVLADHDRVAEHLHEHGQGDYAIDEQASLPLLADSRTGPAAVRLPALLTFRGPGRGAAVRAVAADPRALTVVQQLNLIRLPASPMPARRFHPGSGGYGVGYADHGRVGVRDTQVKVQPRFRVGPGAAPIVFQVDPAVPEPFRSAVVEGGNWWREAFARIGLPDAYRVEAAAEGFDPYDPDVNGVVWVHRAGRGWSLGQGLTDPRTGEILHARVRLGSQRVEQVRALGEALLAPYGRPDEAERLAAVEELVLARLRQLAAHEIGHALGFMHNFASTRHPKPSVMDYPHARIGVTEDGTLDLRAAYGTGLGPWDHFVVAHAYGDFAEADEETALAALRRQAVDAGLLHVTDEDATGPGAAHADGVPWVTGGDAPAALETMLRVRRIALNGFSRSVLPPGRQTGELEERAALLHLLHRHEVAALARLIGGVRYAYELTGEPGGGALPLGQGPFADAPDDGSPAAGSGGGAVAPAGRGGMASAGRLGGESRVGPGRDAGGESGVELGREAGGESGVEVGWEAAGESPVEPGREAAGEGGPPLASSGAASGVEPGVVPGGSGGGLSGVEPGVVPGGSGGGLSGVEPGVVPGGSGGGLSGVEPGVVPGGSGGGPSRVGPGAGRAQSGAVPVQVGHTQPGEPGTVLVGAGAQRKALAQLAGLLRAEQLALPGAVLDALTPPAIRYARTDQYLDTGAGRVFDPFEAVRAAVALVTEQLLEPARLTRLAWQHAVDPAMPGVTDVVDALLAVTWRRADPVPGDLPGGEAVQHTADWTLLNHLLTVLDDDTPRAQVRAHLRGALRRLATELRAADDDRRREAADLISGFLTDPGSVRLDPLPRVPPGAPN
ncbi:zinc-dependent metalloprotease [Streptomyces sp. NPDC050619]|uniref:zinc-dependent metalloprotease n=1 Tax=Streptomyces sp. NPDC050619 TaxID=3157214 RepID=UPI00342A83C3